MTTFGIDVSKWQEPLDWPRVYADGNRFMFARASIGTTIDPKYGAHVPNADRAGLLPGAYHYLWPDVSPAAAVKTFLHVVGDPEGKLLALDVEEGGLHTAEVRAWVAEFRKQQPVHPLFIYISRGFWGKLGRPKLSTLGPLWLAYWPDGGYPGDSSSVWTSGFGGWDGPTIWQYGSRRTDGQKVDGNAIRTPIEKLLPFAYTATPPDTSTGDAMNPLLISSTDPKLVTIPDGVQLYNPDRTALVKKSGEGTRPSPFGARYSTTEYRLLPVIVDGELRLAMVRNADVTITDPPAEPSELDIDRARTEGYQAGLADGSVQGAAAENERLALAEAARIRSL